jgi:DNA-binding transcriptional ArsR family regulator
MGERRRDQARRGGNRKIAARNGVDSFLGHPILNQMVKLSHAALDRTFAALADPTRRALLARLSQTDNLSISQLAEPFSMSLPAVMKHLDVLSDAGLVTRNKNGRTVACRLRAEPMEEANRWLNRYQKFWTDRLDQLAAFLEEDTWPPQPPSSRASPSSAASTRRPRKSLPPGSTRKK